MLKLSLKNIWAYKTRFALSMLSVVLGVAFLVGTLVFTATIRSTFNDLFSTVYASTDAVMRSTETQSNAMDFSETRENLPVELLDEVKNVEGVSSAAGNIEINMMVVIGEDGKNMFPAQGPPALGFGATATEELNIFRLIGPDGKNLSNEETLNTELAENEILLDKTSADLKNLEAGDSVKIVHVDEVREYKIKGLIRLGTADGLGGAGIFVFNEKEAFELANKGNTFASIEFAAQDGVSQEELKANLEQFIRANDIANVEVLTGEEITKENQEGAAQFIDFFGYILSGFAAVAFLVALIIIMNSFAIVITQRKREYALLRAVGATSFQIKLSVTLEALFTGLLASVVGIGLGYLLAQGIIALLESTGLTLAVAGITLTWRTVLFGMLVGTLATIVSALVPAISASRISPMEALRESAYEKQRGWKFRIIGVLLLAAIGITILIYSFSQSGLDRIATTGIAILIFLFTFIAALPLLVKPFTAIVGSKPAGVVLLPFGGRHAFGVTGEISRRNNVRNPRRTSRTSLALMIGVALVVFITVVVSSASTTLTNYVDENYSSDFIIGDFASNTLTEQRCAQIDSEFYLQSSTCFYLGSLNYSKDVQDANIENASERIVIGLNTKEVPELFRTEYEGDITNLGVDGMAITKRTSQDNDLDVGDKVLLRGNLGSSTYEIKSIVEERLLGDTGDYVLDMEGFKEIQEPGFALLSMATIDPNVSAQQAKSNLETLLADTGIEVLDQKSFKELQLDQINGVLNFFYALLALAIVIAVIGIINTMSLSVIERKKELGLMRAVGTLKPQVRGFIRFESIIIAVLGTTVGMVFGMLGSYLFILSLRDEGFSSYSIDPATMIIILLFSAFLGSIAGWWPAYRATRAKILDSIAVD